MYFTSMAHGSILFIFEIYINYCHLIDLFISLSKYMTYTRLSSVYFERTAIGGLSAYAMYPPCGCLIW